MSKEEKVLIENAIEALIRKKFEALVSKEKTNTVSRNKERITNRKRLRESQQIALKVLNKLDELGWSQRNLALKMGVTPQQITKLVSGKENLTLATQMKLQEILDIPILASYYEQKEAVESIEAATFKSLHNYTTVYKGVLKKEVFFTSKEIRMKLDRKKPEHESYQIQG